MQRQRQTYEMIDPTSASGSRSPISTGDPDRAGVMHKVGGLGHVQACRAQQQQHKAGDDGEQDAIHGLHAVLKAARRDPGPNLGLNRGSLGRRGHINCRSNLRSLIGIVPNGSIRITSLI